jgi:AcrR family transcriptional regulator
MGRRSSGARHERGADDGVEAALVSVARTFFAERGYADTSLNMIVEAAGFTKGAVYYYFSDKRDLFREVYVAEQRRLSKVVVAAFREEPDPWEAFHAGVRAFIGGLLDPSVRRIVLIDAPVALGWNEIRDAAQPSALKMIRSGLATAAEVGLIAEHRVDLLANFVYGIVCEAAHLVGNSQNPDEIIEPVLGELRDALDRLTDRVPAAAPTA